MINHDKLFLYKNHYKLSRHIIKKKETFNK